MCCFFHLLKQLLLFSTMIFSKQPEKDKECIDYLVKELAKYVSYPAPVGLLVEELLKMLKKERLLRGFMLRKRFRQDFPMMDVFWSRKTQAMSRLRCCWTGSGPPGRQ